MSVPPHLAEALRVLDAAWSPPLTRDQATLYAEMLADIPGRDLADIVRRLVATARYRPGIADIRRAYAEALACVPTDAVAVEQAEALAEWEAETYTLGANRPPARPTVHPAVESAYHAAGIDHHPSFLRAYRAEREVLIADLAAQPHDRALSP